MEQIGEEIRGAFEFLESVYKPFGFTYKVGLSTRNPAKWMGDLKVWDAAEASLRSVLEEKVPGGWHVNAEDAAFYGPKVRSHLHHLSSTDGLRLHPAYRIARLPTRRRTKATMAVRNNPGEMHSR